MKNNEAQKLILTANQVGLAKHLKISEDFLRLLLSRGHLEDDLQSFLCPSIDDMCSPFDIKNVDVASDRIKSAIRNKEKILIFGDYDCDGICAISILMLYLKDKTDVFYFIPNRNKDGYGMTVEALESIVLSNRPDLVITVDCGITAIAEVDYLNSKHIDTIVTDHHEPQAILPNCIVVDPKIEKIGFYDFCGAGVALKLVEALGGRLEAMKYLDIAAIATIADVVPLEKDNRIIASFGLKSLMSSPRKGVAMLTGAEKVTSQDVMFKLAPRMNAAGRLDSAMKVVDLFLETDFFMLRSLADELARDNTLRQEICEEVVADAKRMLCGINFDKTRMIVLSKVTWEAGVLGIAAARLAEEFKCPVLLLAFVEGQLKGSARSIESVNLFDLFSKLSKYFVNFGGHAQAAGVTINPSNLDEFTDAANVLLLETHSAEEFLPKVVCEMELDIGCDVMTFVKELELLEPTGYCNKRPHFLIKSDGLRFEKIGFSSHIKCSTKNIDILGFRKFENYIDALRGKIELQATLGLNVFQNSIKAQAIVGSLEIVEISIDEASSKMMMIHQLDYECKATKKLTKVSNENIRNLLKNPFGTLIVCFSQAEYENLASDIEDVKSLPLFVGQPNFLNPQNCVVLCPSKTIEYGYFLRVIIAGRAMCQGYIDEICERSVESFAFGNTEPDNLYLDESKIRDVFRALRSVAESNERMTSEKKLYETVRKKIDISQLEFFAVLSMFKELMLLSVSERGMISISNNKTELKKSAIYRNTRQTILLS